MQKEYIPAILLYIFSALLYAGAVACIFMDSHHWATLVLLGAALMLFASSQLVKIGKKLREKEESKEQKEET